MKQELLEYLIRECVHEILETFPVGIREDDTIGAPAPPAGNQGTADQPAVPPGQPDVTGAPGQSMMNSKGMWFVDPKKGKPTQVKLTSKDPNRLSRELYMLAAKVAGPRVKVSLDTQRRVPQAMANPAMPLFLYIGKQDEDSDELYLLNAPDYETAKNGSTQASAEHPTTSVQAPPEDLAGIRQQTMAGGKTTAPDIDESNQLREMLSSMIKEAMSDISKKKKLSTKSLPKDDEDQDRCPSCKGFNRKQTGYGKFQCQDCGKHHRSY